MRHLSKKILVQTLIAALVFVGFTQSVQAALIGTGQVAAVAAAEQNRAKVAAALARDDVQAELRKMGVSAEQARARVAALTDAEAASVANQVDSLPAGGDVLGALVFIFVLLLVTDILGLTHVFPFTRSARR